MTQATKAEVRRLWFSTTLGTAERIVCPIGSLSAIALLVAFVINNGHL